MVGSITRQNAQIFLSDKFFIGTDGFSEKCGFTGKDHIRSQTVRDMAEQARQGIVLTESEKFLCQGSERTVRAEDVSQVFTDDRIPADKEAFLQSRDVIVHKVSLAVSGESASYPHITTPAHAAPIAAPVQ